ncbi:putative toxin-antitoxin system antitoxin component, TIGR02293 family [Tistlia consotensis]|uniref:Putative toxin-antitoxin system antitoxin component, TIGR02293 family n=1 Tax=Tistlia consotensis USBA 355 TaxID=560819 RepID=A0A1Y6BTL4_9PROT|nr:antitoxin Xre/MbcA/ParS toxin-binding domain-containing protein [Tistlia consotensis]SMF28142.1 putative toxin-antitoxin system antitoxin component, TIGR02293 family [Tistlia consotensis USBA 355]SNR65127.1 putative toxin-antitoxin system antitoxin component, TIGR02293 family [Tistlia consotensis]
MTMIDAYARPETVPASEPARLALLLALAVPPDFDDVALARRVTEGLPVKCVTAMARILGRSRVVGPIVPEATLRRVRKAGKPLSREHSGRLYEVSRVIDAVGRAFHGDSERIKAFLGRPHPLLDGETPFDLACSSSAGADAVLNLLQRAEAGVAL